MTGQDINARLSFGLYEIDVHTGELWKAGFRIKLQGQPFKVLTILLEKPGQVVTREELQTRLWGKDTVVDFDHSLGTAINKIREALGDSAENPRFIETLARRGYRFIAPVGVIEPAAVLDPGTNLDLTANGRPTTRLTVAPLPLPTDSAAATTLTPPTPVSVAPVARAPGISRLLLWSLIAITLCAAGAIGYYTASSHTVADPPHIVQITHNGHLAPSVDTMENLAAAATDGVHLYASTIDGGHSVLSTISISGGLVEPLNIPSEVASPALGDISPDGSRLLLRDHLSPESEQPLWIVPTTGGSALRVGDVLAHDATWMPNNGGILYANGTNLYLSTITSSTPQLYASLPGRAFWLRWEPNGKLLRFTILDPVSHTLSIWQITPTDRTPHRILADFNQPAAECCGVWTANGRTFVFQSSKGGNNDLWQLSGLSTTNPTRLTDGPLEFESPVAARSGNRIFFMGADSRSELESVSPTGQLVPVKGFLSNAARVDYTRDGKWVVWTDTDTHLWRARSDGTEKLQVTPDTLTPFLARWSPDGSHIAVMAREAGKAWQIYITSANGGDFTPLLHQTRNAADPSWSPDGKSIAFGGTNDAMGKDNATRTLDTVDVATGALQEIPNSTGLFSPRWSPDGRYIAALTGDQRQVRLYTVATRTWTTLAVPSGADPVWSPDSHYLFLHASLDPAQPIDRVTIPDGHVDEIVRLADSREHDAVDYVFGGLDQNNRPLIRARIFTGNFYSLDLK
ncbi:winged helix-turn-helix domain-containing protein [Granulicella sp. L46]|uniref:winged helix-turn-helix domain-containing protein n=1 Tax=Granulicella sp. L46 TaxID=1641865 RepID=UPI00131D1C20|nr:winged helix-turn-helix domain-containing protein [Granulicella sp. L46]